MALRAPAVRRAAPGLHAARGGGPPGGFGGGFGGNVFPTPGEETGFFFMLPKKKKLTPISWEEQSPSVQPPHQEEDDC